MKNNFCLFERPFKLQKNGAFIFEISFFLFTVPSLKNTSLIFLEIFFIQHFTILVANNMTLLMI